MSSDSSADGVVWLTLHSVGWKLLTDYERAARANMRNR